MKAMWTVLLMLVICASAFALAPAQMSYQGVLTDGAGAPVANGTYNLHFALYDVATGGTALWTETQELGVGGGVFSAILGSVTPLALPFDKPYYLGVAVEGGEELAPRTLLTSAAYSLNAPVVAFASSGGTTSLTAEWVNYEGDSVTITCPGPGYVVVQSSTWMQLFHAASSTDRILAAHDVTPTGSGPGYTYVAAYSVPSGAAVGTYDVSMPVQTVFPVISAGTYTYFLNGTLSTTGTTTAHFWYANTVATWYPGTMPNPDLQRMAQPMKSMPVGR